MSTTNNLQLWLNQYVWVGNETIKRRDYIPDFAEALTAFAAKKGYTMDVRWKKGHLVVAKWLHSIHRQEYCYNSQGNLVYPEVGHRSWQEDDYQFYHVLSREDVQQFMETWDCEDMCLDTRVGNRVLNEIHSLLWTYVDLDTSKQGQVVLERLEDSDSDSDGWEWRKPRVDQYLQDANDGYHGGRWAKV